MLTDASRWFCVLNSRSLFRIRIRLVGRFRCFLRRFIRLVPAVSEKLYRLTLSLGGMITGEHGIGSTRRGFLPMALDEAQIRLMRQIKAAFDPENILNPGKIFP